jgi:hypothetical protein
MAARRCKYNACSYSGIESARKSSAHSMLLRFGKQARFGRDSGVDFRLASVFRAWPVHQCRIRSLSAAQDEGFSRFSAGERNPGQGP